MNFTVKLNLEKTRDKLQNLSASQYSNLQLKLAYPKKMFYS